MNCYHPWKFILSIVALSLACAVATQAQNSSCPGNATWATDCATATGQPMNTCELVSGVCQMQVSEATGAATSIPASTTSNPGVLCFSLPSDSSVTIQWKPAVNNAGFIVQFGSSSPLVDNSSNTIEAVAATTNAGYQGGNISGSAGTQDGTCYEYAVAYCPPNQACVTADPRVWVQCQGPSSTCPPGTVHKKPHK